MYKNKKLEAIAAARKICGEGECRAPFPCGHSNRIGGLPPITEVTVCPLAKYNVEPSRDTRPWYERPREETEVTHADLFAICAMCEHSEVKTQDGKTVVELVRFDKVCIDCPVQACKEHMDEAAAEARSNRN